MNIPIQQLFSAHSPVRFEQLALDIFRYQATANKVYASFVKNLGIDIPAVRQIEQIPFLPIGFFKSHDVICDDAKPQIVFTSSGTTGMVQSRHLVTDVSLYERSYLAAFNHFYDDVSHYAILALLPSYQEREGSSLIYMTDDLIRRSNHTESGYFLYNQHDLYQTLQNLKALQIPTILLGVTYALLDFIEQYTVDFPELIVMETGGMKGRRKEMIRTELHQLLCKGFGVTAIHSEYGMTELLSQAYSKSDGIFRCPGWMKVLLRDTNDPLSLIEHGHTGGINVIDLANIHSCSFIATQDLGKLYPDDSFEVIGRFDNSDIRGCNLLVQ
ncbi:acyl transferase [Pedobacter sp. BS3]|uniref:acyl transferase n=1 Tax=Pedobacter sp. BS3 TaxID=2567937 RepID=UPI0011EEC7F0|nr:acyl transferase [Pedobacter sp. BS3]TZF82569.1 acyl transferase [Pedobacter sp. BS3]